MLLNNVFLMTGALLALTSRAAKSFEMIIISRVLVGINAGMCLCVPTLRSEPRTFRNKNERDVTNERSLGLHNRSQHERAAHVLRGKCTQAFARRHLPVVSRLHGVRGRAGPGGRPQVLASRRRDDFPQRLHVTSEHSQAP